MIVKLLPEKLVKTFGRKQGDKSELTQRKPMLVPERSVSMPDCNDQTVNSMLKIFIFLITWKNETERQGNVCKDQW